MWSELQAMLFSVKQMAWINGAAALGTELPLFMLHCGVSL